MTSILTQNDSAESELENNWLQFTPFCLLKFYAISIIQTQGSQTSRKSAFLAPDICSTYLGEDQYGLINWTK